MTPEYDQPDSPVCGGTVGERFSIEELMQAMLAVSDNTATDMLASILGERDRKFNTPIAGADRGPGN